jgi:TonB family protein
MSVDNANRLVKFRQYLRDLPIRIRITNERSTIQRQPCPGVSVSAVEIVLGRARAVASGPVKVSALGVYRVGGGVSAPVLIHKVDRDYTEEARKAKYKGTVLLYVEIDPTGTATNIRVQRSLGLGLDEKAVEAVRQWKFKPGHKDEMLVTVAATTEMNFGL